MAALIPFMLCRLPFGRLQRKLAMAAVLLLVVLAGSRDVHADQEPAAGPLTTGQRMATCGHSFHVFVYRIVDQLAKSAGYADHQSVGISSIGGSRIIQHWDVPDAKSQVKAALLAGKVDVLTLSPIWFPDQGIDNFAKLAFEHNPNIRIFVQEFWLPNDTYEPKYPLDTKKQVDHNATDLAELQKHNDDYCRDVEAYCASINKRLGKDVLWVVPVGQASIALRLKIAAGQAPGLTVQWDLFRDMWGHAQPPLQVLDGYCHFAEIYRRSPVGLPLPADLAKLTEWAPKKGVLGADSSKPHTMGDEDKAKLNRLLQEIAWETVTHHPMTGLSPQSPGK